MTTDCLSTIKYIRKSWEDITKILRESRCQYRILYPAILSAQNEAKQKSFETKECGNFLLSDCHWGNYWILYLTKKEKRPAVTGGFSATVPSLLRHACSDWSGLCPDWLDNTPSQISTIQIIPPEAMMNKKLHEHAGKFKWEFTLKKTNERVKKKAELKF